jgi:MFS family permease
MSATSPGLRRALGHRDLRLLFGGLVVSAAGSWAYNVALIVYAYEETHSASWVAAATVGRFIPTLLTQSYAGVLAERFERVRVMVTADLLCALWMTIVAVLAAAHAPVLLVLVFAGLTSVTAGVYPPAVTAMIPQVAGEEDLAAANALNGTVDNLAIIAGPAIGAGLLLIGPPPVAFAINAATFLYSATLVMRMEARSKPTDVTAEGNAFTQVVGGFKAITTSTTAAVLVGFSVLASFIYGTDTVSLVYVSQQKLGTGADGYGYLLACLGVGGVLAAMLVDRLASSPHLGLIIVIGMGVYCLPTALLTVTHSPAVAMGIEAVRGGGTLIVDVLAITLLQRSLPQEMIARVFGAFFTLVLAAISLGSLVTSQLLSIANLDTTLLLLAFVVPALCAAFWPYLNRMDQAAVGKLAELRPRITLLEALDIFAAAKRPTLERLAAALEEVDVPTGRAVVEEGAEADALWIVVSGEVAVTARGELDQPRLLRTMGPRSYFGEIGLLEHIPRTATVKALEPTRLYRLPGDEFLDALTASTGTASLLEGARTRLARTNPSYQPSYITLPVDKDEPNASSEVILEPPVLEPSPSGWPSD